MLLFFILILSLEIHFAMINNKNKLLMTSIIAMTFLIGFTANEAYAGVNPVEDRCEDGCISGLLVHIDIKPESCPNPVNSNSRGLLPVAILGNLVDVDQIDVDTILLAGVSPIRHDVEDVATPHTPNTEVVNPNDCTIEGPDGIDDLTLKFDTQQVLDALDASRGDLIQVLLTGNLLDGTVIHSYDVIIVR